MTRRSFGTFGFSLTLLMMPVLSNAQGVVAPASENRITILYDAFGKDPSMRKDWGFSALVEVAGKRILFDTGDNRDIFAANVKAKNVDLTKLDFVVLSHRHGDHMAGLAHVLSVNPSTRPRRVSGSTAHRCRRASIARLRHCRRTCATSTASHPR
jgi:7,8-dihydropterin-6-yl-methyl-4-(beta-D-ribofuranosyl)aminobenzene 5'-phosphate synthase